MRRHSDEFKTYISTKKQNRRMELCLCFKTSRSWCLAYTIFSTIIYVRKSNLLKPGIISTKKGPHQWKLWQNSPQTGSLSVWFLDNQSCPLELYASIKALSSDGGYSSRWSWRLQVCYKVSALGFLFDACKDHLCSWNVLLRILQIDHQGLLTPDNTWNQREEKLSTQTVEQHSRACPNAKNLPLLLLASV